MLSFSCSLEPGGRGYQWICHRADKIKRKGQKSQIRQMNGGKIQPLSRTVAEGTSQRKIHLELLAEEVEEISVDEVVVEALLGSGWNRASATTFSGPGRWWISQLNSNRNDNLLYCSKQGKC